MATAMEGSLLRCSFNGLASTSSTSAGHHSSSSCSSASTLYSRILVANFKPYRGCTCSSASRHWIIRSSSQTGSETVQSDEAKQPKEEEGEEKEDGTIADISLDKDISKVVRKTAATFAPRASTKSKNPAVPGTVLYTVFEVQGYLSMAVGGLLSFNLVFPSNEPDIWRLMGMWSVWMFTIPSLRARDCSNKEKDALNYLFVGIPLINVLLPIFWKSFAAVWAADVVAFFIMYAWKLDWLAAAKEVDE